VNAIEQATASWPFVRLQMPDEMPLGRARKRRDLSRASWTVLARIVAPRGQWRPGPFPRAWSCSRRPASRPRPPGRFVPPPPRFAGVPATTRFRISSMMRNPMPRRHATSKGDGGPVSFAATTCPCRNRLRLRRPPQKKPRCTRLLKKVQMQGGKRCAVRGVLGPYAAGNRANAPTQQMGLFQRRDYACSGFRRHRRPAA